MDREYMQPVPGVEGRAVSLWIDTAPPTRYPKLEGSFTADVAVVGGGLVGTLTAALLVEQGKRVALLESGRVGCNTTGHTTAKVTVQHGYVYHDLARHLGEYEALVYLEANLAGSNRIAELVARHHLDCDYHRTPFYLFALDEQDLDRLRMEAETVAAFGLPSTLLPAQDEPFPMPGAMRVENQAQFHPLKFVTGLLKALAGDRLAVFEHTRALGVDDAETCTVHCEDGEVRARNVVVATQFPFYDTGAFFTRLYPYQDYAVGVRLRGRTLGAMMHDLEHYGIRTFPAPGDPLLIVSGGSHKTGQGGDEREKYAALLDWTRGNYDVERVEYHWSTEDYYTPDGMPFIGRSPGSSRVFLATGFAAWGMTNSAASAVLISDAILGRENRRWVEVFDPARTRPIASWRAFLRENVDVAKQLVGGKVMGARDARAADLLRGEGALVSEAGGARAAFRRADGQVVLLEPACRHMGCTVSFNEAELTWDCPCHGSRYSAEGRVVHGPALRPLKQAGIPAEGIRRAP